VARFISIVARRACCWGKTLAVHSAIVRLLPFLAAIGPAAAIEETSEGQRILVYEKSIQLKYAPQSMAWAPDNRHLAVKGFNDAKLHVIDTRDDTASDRIILDNVGNASIAWSPDGQTIAVHHRSGGFNGIQLASVLNAQETARRVVGNDGCLLAANPIAFTHDGSALWLTCRFPMLTAPETFPVAIKYRLPDLVADDPLVLQSPVADGKAVTFAYSLAHINNSLWLSAIIGYDVSGTRRLFAYGFDLGRKAELFPHFEPADDNRSGLFRYPNQLILVPDATYGLVRLSTGTRRPPGVSTDDTSDRLFDGYDLRTGQRLVTFGGNNSQAPEAGVVGEVALLRDGRSLVGRWSRAAAREGGLVIFDARTGTVHQRIRFGENLLLALSPDGGRLASLTRQNEIRLYQVGR
jgi:WD40 repeat protein